MAYYNIDRSFDLFESYESPSVSVTHNDDGTTTMWPIIMAKFDTFYIAGCFEDLHMTPDEVCKVVNNVLERVNDEMLEYMANYVSEVR